MNKKVFLRGMSIYLSLMVLISSCFDLKSLAIPLSESRGFRDCLPDSLPWDGSSVELMGNGSKNDPYLIESASNLAYMAEFINRGGI